MIPKHKGSDTDNLEKPKESGKVLPLREKVKVLDLHNLVSQKGEDSETL